MVENLTSIAGQRNLSQTPPSVERVTNPAAEMTNSKNVHKRSKDPKRVVVGCADATSREAKEE